jgi:hypothetical protein
MGGPQHHSEVSRVKVYVTKEKDRPGSSAAADDRLHQASDMGSIPIARSISLDDSVAFMRLSR